MCARVCVCSSVQVHVSPALGQWHLEQGLGQLQLLLLDSVAEHLSVRVVSVGLVRQLKQLPDGHPQRPAGQPMSALGSAEAFLHEAGLWSSIIAQSIIEVFY